MNRSIEVKTHITKAEQDLFISLQGRVIDASAWQAWQNGDAFGAFRLDQGEEITFTCTFDCDDECELTCAVGPQTEWDWKSLAQPVIITNVHPVGSESALRLWFSLRANGQDLQDSLHVEVVFNDTRWPDCPTDVCVPASIEAVKGGAA